MKASSRWKWRAATAAGKETIGDVDLLVDAKDVDAVMDHLGKFARRC